LGISYHRISTIQLVLSKTVLIDFRELGQLIRLAMRNIG
jgi:hypothetical protein